MRNALKLFHFCKKVDPRKGIFFLFYQIVMETLFYESTEVESLYESQFRQFCDENTVYLVFNFVLNKNQSDWSMASHSA